MNIEDIYEQLKTKEISDKIPFSHKYKTKDKVINMSIGRVWINLLTPENYPLIDEQITSKKIKAIINDIYDKYEPAVTAKFIDLLNQESFKLGTVLPSSFDIDALIVPPFILEKKQQLLAKETDPVKFNEIAFTLAQEYLEYIRTEHHSSIYNILMSGAKGSPADWALLMIAKGSQIDIENNESANILNSLNDGLTIEEFYISAASARQTQYLKSKGSADPGYLARQGVFANANTILSKNEDCGTKRFFNLSVTNSNFKKILGRYYYDEKTKDLKLIAVEKDAKRLVGSTILLRSPLYCIEPNDGICKTCYGKLAEILETDKIGIITGSIINDYGVNFAMKARHMTSQISLKKVDFTKDIVIY